MPTGQPITAKCPSCRAGQHNHPGRPHVQRLGEFRERRTWGHRRRGSVTKRQEKMRCLDCGHEWWSTLTPQHPTVTGL